MSKRQVNERKWLVNARKCGTIVALSTTLLLLAACAPFSARTTRTADVVTIVVTAGGVDLTLVGVSIIGDNLSTADPRCVLVEAGALSCDLGDMSAGTEAFILVVGESVKCIATGYAGTSIQDYRVARCANAG